MTPEHLTFDVEAVRSNFPGVVRAPERVFFDNPAGTQIAGRAIERMVSAMTEANSNLGGFFDTSLRAAELVAGARQTAAAFLNAPSPDEIIFGQSMTALTFAISQALGTTMKSGDAVLLTRMDHDADVAPWLQMAEERELEVRWLDFDPDTCEFDLTALDRLVDERLKVAAVNYASNVTGTINDVGAIAARVRAAGGLTYVDAVQFAPHGVIDVQALGCDFLVCSGYKFFGPHCSILWGRAERLDALPARKVRPAPDRGPGKWEQGTQSRELIAGVAGAIEHFAWLGDQFGRTARTASLRERITAGISAADAYERALTKTLIGGLTDFEGLCIHGLSASQTLGRRVPTISFTMRDRSPQEIARAMAKQKIQVWSGHNYGIEPVRQLGLDLETGVLRVGLAHYNTAEEVTRFLETLDEVAKS